MHEKGEIKKSPLFSRMRRQKSPLLFEAGDQLNAGALNQSSSSNHALLITKSALVIKKMPSDSANQHSVILPRM